MDRRIIQKMADDMGHCGNIASSALVLATERSSDIEVPIVITLMMLKKLCDANIEVQLYEKIPDQLHELADLAGFNMDKVRMQAFKDMETLIDEFFTEHGLIKKAFGK